jgi:hypothetical protein
MIAGKEVAIGGVAVNPGRPAAQRHLLLHVHGVADGSALQ